MFLCLPFLLFLFSICLLISCSIYVLVSLILSLSLFPFRQSLSILSNVSLNTNWNDLFLSSWNIWQASIAVSTFPVFFAKKNLFAQSLTLFLFFEENYIKKGKVLLCTPKGKVTIRLIFICEVMICYTYNSIIFNISKFYKSI